MPEVSFFKPPFSPPFFLEHGSDEFNEFLSVLGEKIALKGWEGYRGGLGITSDTTGTHSVFGKYSGYNIMFHVSTLMPYSTSEKQQVCTPLFLSLEAPFFIRFFFFFFFIFPLPSSRERGTSATTL